MKSDVFNGDEVIDVSFNWFEPVIGVIFPISYKRFQLELLSDIGFGENDISFFLNGSLKYRISKLIDVQAGWAHLTLNRNDSAGSTNFDTRITLTGPAACVGFHF